jgi:hypothetical protein
MFRAMFSPIIRSTWLYLQYLVVYTQVAAGWCLEWVETELCRLWGVYTRTRLKIYIVQFQLIRDTKRQLLGCKLPDTVNTVKCSNKLSNQMQQSLSFIACRLNLAQYVLGSLMPIIRSLSNAVRSERPRPTILLPPRSNGKPEAATGNVVGRGRSRRTDHDQQHCYHHVPTVNQRRLLQLITPDDGHEDARNMLSCI